ncbi:MAG: NADAR family protein [Methanobrevibacter olleyae]|uniref:NADAR family protein n=1 Tax=Methanobrevibacter olleyae TaxID=294671 RepID=A0A8T3VNN1_METOL|nr:NADAR family protein [Methanobrevibacter olleyae]
MVFSKIKNKILKKEKEETPFERAKRDIEEHYIPIAPEDTLKNLKYYVSDVIAPPELEEKYNIGRILNEPRFIDFTAKVGGLQGTCRYLILSNHMVPSSDPEFKDLDVYINRPNSKFKVVDFFRYQGITQIALLHLPDDDWETLKKKRHLDLMDEVRDVLLDCLKMDVIPELESKSWQERDLLPIGITNEGNYFELDALNNYGFFNESTPTSLSDKEEIDYAFKRYRQLTEPYLTSYSIADLIFLYGLNLSEVGDNIRDKLWTDIKNGLPLVKVDERFIKYFKEEYRKKYPYASTNFIELELFVKTDNESKSRLDEILKTEKLFNKFVYSRRGFNEEYEDLLSSKGFDYLDLFTFKQFLYEKIEKEEINSKNFNEKVDEYLDEYYEEFIYNRNNYPKTIEKAIAFLIRNLDEESIKEIKNMEKSRFSISSHFFLGMYIRNQYGINNRKNKELLSDCNKKSNNEILGWADSYSRFILDELWEEINENYSKIIQSKNDSNSFYYKKVEEGKIPAPVWFRYPYSQLKDFLDEDYLDEIDRCKENNINIPSPFNVEVDKNKPTQYLKAMEELKIIREHTMGCLPFSSKGEPKCHISLLKEKFRLNGHNFFEMNFSLINDSTLDVTELDSFIYSGCTFLRVYDFIDINRSYLFNEIDSAKKEIKKRNKFKFFNARINDRYESFEEVKDIYDLDDGLLFVFENKRKELEENKRKNVLWEEIVQNYTKEEIWDKIKYSVALNGIYVKAMQNNEFREYLLNTRDKFLVNYNIYENEWALHEEDKKLIGKNLYGLALMEVRDEIRRLYENADMIDWEYYKDDYNKDYDLNYVD